LRLIYKHAQLALHKSLLLLRTCYMFQLHANFRPANSRTKETGQLTEPVNLNTETSNMCIPQ